MGYSLIHQPDVHAWQSRAAGIPSSIKIAYANSPCRVLSAPSLPEEVEMTRPFRILGVQQIAIGGPSKAALRCLWVDLLGVPAIGRFRSERENVDEDIQIGRAHV